MLDETTDADFLRDCWRYLQARAPRLARIAGDDFTVLECELILTLAYVRLKQARTLNDADPSAEIVFHVPLRDVSDATWRLFAQRTRQIA
jgi:hypothetical protein